MNKNANRLRAKGARDTQSTSETHPDQQREHKTLESGDKEGEGEGPVTQGSAQGLPGK